MVNFWWKPTSWLADSCILPCPHMAVGRERERERERERVSSGPFS